MPSNILTADTSFPNLRDDQSTDEKFGIVTNYLYMLLEQLRYSLSNLGVENFNDSELDELVNIISEPIYIQLSDVEGNVSSLYVEVDNVTSRLQSAEGNISTLQQTSDSLMSSVSTLEGNVSTLQQTASSLQSQITNAEGEISTIQQTVNGIALTVEGIEGDVSAIQQTVGSITLTVQGIEGDISTIQQTVNGIHLGVVNGTSGSTISLYRDGVAVSSQYIQFTGMVTFSDLSTQGQTSINGGNIAAGGTISGVTLQSLSGSDSGLEIRYGNKQSNILVGGIKYDNNGEGTEEEARTRMFIYTEEPWAMKLQSGAAASFVAEDLLYLEGKTEMILSSGTGNLVLRGNIYINGTAIDDYIRQVTG